MIFTIPLRYNVKWKQFIDCMFVCSMYSFIINNKAHILFILIISKFSLL